jgi:hypothetical protein
MKNVETLLGLINPAAVPALRIAGALFPIIYFLAGAYFFRHRRRLFGRDPRVDGDNEATRHIRIYPSKSFRYRGCS